MQHFKEMERSQSKVVSRLTIGMMAPLHPKSTGNIRLKSKDPFDHPLIDPQALREKEDVKTIIRGRQVPLNISVNKYEYM
jgi:choline dehydrogenase-like flavoprotein